MVTAMHIISLALWTHLLIRFGYRLRDHCLTYNTLGGARGGAGQADHRAWVGAPGPLRALLTIGGLVLSMGALVALVGMLLTLHQMSLNP